MVEAEGDLEGNELAGAAYFMGVEGTLRDV